ncbi:hypothetical protein KY290_007399 [Solanum tuberosum]|uniref:PB1-like domain-containing protein n=1 Tax=Solanum tuberosum TaxID=4113 RepID=A0ABQ7W5G8_SOLTU|nr:hypothetical protein KY290_007399 [Solanum tuberosum]
MPSHLVLGNGLRKKNKCLIDNDDVKLVELRKSSKTTPIKENLPKQHVEELVYQGSMDTQDEIEISYNYDGYFIFSPSRKYVSGQLVKTSMDIDFVSYFDLLDDLKKQCKFDILEGDKFFYLRGDRTINDYDGLVECRDDSDVKDMIVSYKMHKGKSFEIYTLPKDCDIVISTSLEESIPDVSEEVIVMEEHQSSNATVRSRSCPLKVNGWKEIEENKIDHMWDIILEKFSFDVFEDRKYAIIGHMSDLYRDYRHKMKSKYFDSKASYQLRLWNKPKRVSIDDWKYLVNLWSDADFQKRSMQNKSNRSKRSLPP